MRRDKSPLARRDKLCFNYSDSFVRNCTWTIKAPMGNSVNLTFSHFEMEDHYGTGNCSYDFLQVTEGEDSPVWRGCGAEIPAMISSSSDTVRVHFQSDYSVAHNGFRLGT